MRAHSLVAMMSPLHGEGPRFKPNGYAQLLAKLARRSSIKLDSLASLAAISESPGGPMF